MEFDIKQMLMVAGAGIVVALLSGKAVRRILLLPFEWIASRTSNKIDDKIIDDAQKDLGIEGDSIETKKEDKND